MPTFYFDIETTGLNPKTDKIITIQWMELDRNSGNAIGKLRVLIEWESNERNMLERFIKESRIDDPYPFAFVPVGYNLGFEHNFLKERTAVHSLNPIDILNKPFLDLRATGIIMNRGEFKGSGLDKITGKKTDGSQIPVWYANKEFDKILDYVKNEAEEFVKFNAWLYKELPECLKKFKGEK